jgi:hypothetical protein
MLIAGRSFTEPAGLLPSSLPSTTLPRRRGGAGQALQAHQRRVADGVFEGLVWFALWPLSSGRFMPWQVLSYGFLHGDVGHLFFNMLGLWMFGAELERLWGRTRYLQFIGGPCCQPPPRSCWSRR